MNLIEITPFQLVLCVFFIIIAGTGSVIFKLRLEKDLAWGTVRTFAQLFLMGYVLKFIFQLNNVILILLLYAFMIFWAAQAIKSRVNEEKIRFFVPTYISMVVSYMLVRHLRWDWWAVSLFWMEEIGCEWNIIVFPVVAAPELSVRTQ